MLFGVYVTKLALFCKSYSRDMHRARRLAESIDRYNVDGIPFYMSVPGAELNSFSQCFGDSRCRFLTDEEILAKSFEAFGALPLLFPSHLLQQLVKLEFWRKGLCENYVWLDSDSYFLKEFRASDFMFDGETPYTVQHKAEELLRFAQAINNQKIQTDLMEMTAKMQKAFGREGEWYDFGGPPLIWSASLLRSLYEDYLIPNKTSIYDLLVRYPCEMQLYGEYLLVSKKVPLKPISPLFKIYHYDAQFFADQERGISEYELAKEYLGVIIQSNWAKLPSRKKTPRVRFKKFVLNFLGQIDRTIRSVRG